MQAFNGLTLAHTDTRCGDLHNAGPFALRSGQAQPAPVGPGNAASTTRSNSYERTQHFIENKHAPSFERARTQQVFENKPHVVEPKPVPFTLMRGKTQNNRKQALEITHFGAQKKKSLHHHRAINRYVSIWKR